ncbi:MAG: hypothetical protein WCF92_01625 [bacterium]
MNNQEQPPKEESKETEEVVIPTVDNSSIEYGTETEKEALDRKTEEECKKKEINKNLVSSPNLPKNNESKPKDSHGKGGHLEKDGHGEESHSGGITLKGIGFSLLLAIFHGARAAVEKVAGGKGGGGHSAPKKPSGGHGPAKH